MRARKRKMKDELPARQVAMMKYINQHIADKGYPPTLREIAAGTNISSISVVWNNLDKLQKRGLVSVTPGTARGIRVL